MTVEHSTLTGSSLHEPKGVATATANKVYLSNGAGSGSWTTIPAAALAASANSFGGQLLHIRDEEAQNTAGTTYVSGAWRTVILNSTKTNEIAGASLASNVITLPAGTYWLEAQTVLPNTCASGQVRIQNTSDSTTLCTGLTQHVGGTGGEQGTGTVNGRFTLASAKNIEFQIRVSASSSAIAGNFGTEVYADIMIWKIA